MRTFKTFLGLCCLSLMVVVTIVTLHLAPVQAQRPADDLFQQGQNHYSQGQYSDAVDLLQNAASQFATDGDALRQAITLSNLSLVYQALGQWPQADGAMQDCFAALSVSIDVNALDHLELEGSALPTNILRVLAPALNTYGQLWFHQGESADALALWRQAADLYGVLADGEGQLRSQINQLQALQSLGLYQQAAHLATHLYGSLASLDDGNPLKSQGFRSLGDAERAIGNLGRAELSPETSSEIQFNAQTALEQALAAATDERSRSTALLSLGITHHALGNREKERQTSINRQGVLPWQCVSAAPPDSAVVNYQQAADYYQRAITIAPDAKTQLATQLNHLTVLRELQQVGQPTLQRWAQLQQQLLAGTFDGDGDNRSRIYAQINLAKQGACLRQAGQGTAIAWEDIRKLLMDAVQAAQVLNDPAAESYARGSLGGLYEYFATLAEQTQTKTEGNDARVWRDNATTLTEQALLIAQPSEFPDIAFQWQWQLGRLKAARGQVDDAIDQYEQAVATLQAVRGNLLTIDSEVQFSFRDNVEPVYRELVDLLLKADTPSQASLQKAIQYIDTLQLSELENFLQCTLATAQLTEQVVDQTAASLYGIVLKDRIEVIVSQPNQALQSHKHFIDYEALEGYLDDLQRNLKRASGRNRARRASEALYDWLIRPFEASLDADTPLEDSSVKVLTFILDGSLRSIPMGVLHDSQRDRYVLERYAVALIPSLNLVEPEPLSRQIDVLAGGISQSVPHPLRDGNLSPLEKVEDEIQAIQAIFPGDYSLFNETFTSNTIENKLGQTAFPVVHLATHGEFSSDPERTFIMMFDKPLYARQVDSLLRTSQAGAKGIKMLVLSACKTASGDRRATLGLAGLTVRAGSRSTLATLWPVNDSSAAAVMTSFYQKLKEDPAISKVEALRRAQIDLWENPNWQAPLHWAPYVLVGNWL